jgi:hypothetical protein
MKFLSSIVGVFLLVLTARAALPHPNLIAEFQFAGPQRILAGTNASNFTNEFCSAEALALRSQTATKLSVWLTGWLQTNLDVSIADGAAKLRPLFDDLQAFEWFGEAGVAPDGKLDAAIAIKLDAGHAQIWQTSLKPFFPAATFKSQSGWMIFDSNPGPLKLGDHLVQETSSQPAGWFYMDVNWPLLAKWIPGLKEFGLPETQFTVTAPDKNLNIYGKFFYPENLAMNLEPWRLPTNTIHAPFDSFTAVRGFASWLQSQKWTQPYQIIPEPNQLFVWSLPSIPYQTYAAIPVPDGTSALSQANSRLDQALASANSKEVLLEQVMAQMTNSRILVTGLPFMSPFFQPLSEATGDFLFFGLFPNTPNTPKGSPLPPELFSRLSIKDLVLYHWEITAARMPQILQLSQFGLMVAKCKQLDGTSAAFKWLEKIGPTFGPTETVITRSGPAELSFERHAPGVFTAAEFYSIANWLEATNFPGCDLNLPPAHRSPGGGIPPHPPLRSSPITFPTPPSGQ